MTETSDKELLRRVDNKITYLVGQFDATLPHLATKEDIAQHALQCRKSFDPKPPKNGHTKRGLVKALTIIGTGIVGLTGAIYAVLHALN
jgi:hypothetical protein